MSVRLARAVAPLVLAPLVLAFLVLAGPPAAGATPPVVPFDETADLFVLDDGSDSVLRISGETITVEITKAQLQAVTGQEVISLNNRDLAVDAAGNIFLTVGHGDTSLEVPKPPASIVRFDRATGDFRVLMTPAQAAAATGFPSDLRGLAFGPDGTLYTNDSGAEAVLKVNPDTGETTILVDRAEFQGDPDIGSTDLDGLIVVDAAGVVYVASDQGPPGVYRITPDGEPSLFARETGMNEIQTLHNTASGGTFKIVYKANSGAVEETSEPLPFDASAEMIDAAIESFTTLGPVAVTGAGTASNPWRIEFLDGTNVSVLRTDDTGLTGGRSFAYTVQYTHLFEPTGLTLDAVGNVYVGDNDPARTIYKITAGDPQTREERIAAISVFVTAEEISAVVGTPRIDIDSGLAFDDAGNLYLGETSTHSLLRFDAAGNNGTIVVTDRVGSQNDFRNVTGTGAELKGGVEFEPVIASPPPDETTTTTTTPTGGDTTTTAPQPSGGGDTAGGGGPQGYSLVGEEGSLFAFGTAKNVGDMRGTPLNAPIIGVAYTPGGEGYWLVAKDGGIFTFGDAEFFGSMGATPLNSPVIGMAATPTGRGYWLFAGDGGIFTFGDAEFFGSMGDQRLNAPVINMEPLESGNGYWLVAGDGGIFTFGQAEFFGSMGDQALNQPVFDMTSTDSDAGYWLVARDGGIFSFGDAGPKFYGSAVNEEPRPTKVIGMDSTPGSLGYWIADASGKVYEYGNAQDLGDRHGQPDPAPMIAFASVPSR